MTMEKLVDRIRLEIDTKIADIERDTESQIRTIEAETQKAIDEFAVQEEQSLQRSLDDYRTELKSERDKGRRMEQYTFELQIIEDIFTITQQRLADIHKRKDYPQILKLFYNEAFSAYCNEKNCIPVVITSPGDGTTVAGFFGKGVVVEESSHVSGGVELRSSDDKFKIVNTVASRLEKGRDHFLKHIKNALED